MKNQSDKKNQDKLDIKIRKILWDLCPDDDYVTGVMAYVKSSDTGPKLTDYILSDDEKNSDDVLLYILNLRGRI